MSTTTPPDAPSATDDESRPGPVASACTPPADIAEEVRRYDTTAEVGCLSRPHYRLTYRVLGDGPPLIWVPGLAARHRQHALVLNRLAERYRTIQYSYPGDEPGDGARLGRIGHDLLVDDLFALIDHLRIGRAFLAGISFGSTIVLKALHREPRRFPRAAIQGGFVRRALSIPERSLMALGRRLPGTMRRLPFRETVLTYNSKPEFPAMFDDRWAFYLEENGRTPIRAVAHRASLLAGLDLRPILPAIPTEVLLIQGREDRIVPRRYFEELQAGLPRSEGAIMPTVGHIPHLTHDRPLAQLIDQWLLPCAPEGCPSHPPGEGDEGGAATAEGGPRHCHDREAPR